MHTNCRISNPLNFLWKSSPTPSSCCPITIPGVFTHISGLSVISADSIEFSGPGCAVPSTLCMESKLPCPPVDGRVAVLWMDTHPNKHLWAAGFFCHLPSLYMLSRPVYTCLYIYVIFAILQECCISKLLELFLLRWNIFHICTLVKYNST